MFKQYFYWELQCYNVQYNYVLMYPKFLIVDTATIETTLAFIFIFDLLKLHKSESWHMLPGWAMWSLSIFIFHHFELFNTLRFISFYSNVKHFVGYQIIKTLNYNIHINLLKMCMNRLFKSKYSTMQWYIGFSVNQKLLNKAKLGD